MGKKWWGVLELFCFFKLLILVYIFIIWPGKMVVLKNIFMSIPDPRCIAMQLAKGGGGAKNSKYIYICNEQIYKNINCGFTELYWACSKCSFHVMNCCATYLPSLAFHLGSRPYYTIHVRLHSWCSLSNLEVMVTTVIGSSGNTNSLCNKEKCNTFYLIIFVL